jgi:fucose permease
VQGPYLALAAALLMLALLFAIVRLPKIDPRRSASQRRAGSALAHRTCCWARSASSCTWAARSASAAS